MAVAANKAYFPIFNDGTYSVPNYGSDAFIHGFELKIPNSTSVWLSGGTKFTLDPGAARAFASNFVISYNPYSGPGLPQVMTVDLNNVGSLGCYPLPFSFLQSINPAEAFAVYVLGDSSGKKQTTAIVATGNNFLLPGYDTWRRIATILINGSSRELVQVTQSGTGTEREYVALQFLTGAGYGPTSFIEIPLSSGFYPWRSPMVTDVFYRMQLTSSDPSDYAAISPYNYADSTTRLPFTIQSPVGSNMLTQEAWIPVGKDANGRNIQYVVVSGSESSPFFGAQQCGWRESMGLQLV